MQSLTKASPSDEAMHFILGRDRADHWVVIETHGLSGGLFTDQMAALRFLRDQSHGRPCAIEITNRRLDFSVAGH